MKYDAEVRSAVAALAPVFGLRMPQAELATWVHAIIQRESSHGATLVTIEPPDKSGRSRRSYGPMMVLNTTVPELGNDPPQRLAEVPALGIYYGVKYFFRQLQRFNGDVVRAVSAYNAGPGGAVLNRQGKYPNQSYVDAVLKWWRLYRGAAVSLGPVLVGAALLGLYLARRRRAA